MKITEEFQREKRAGEPGFVNKNCWLARNLNYSPSKRCRNCEARFNSCLFFQYLIISLILVFSIMALSFLVEGRISKLVIVSIFILVLVYGYFFNRSTEEIIEANFAQKKAKNSLEELTKGLQQKIEEQTKDLKRAYEIEKKAKEEVESLDRSKDQFLLATQHHLRTPLSSIMGYLDLLQNGTYGKQNKKTKEILKKFQSLTEDLIKMVNEFLDITQFQLGKEVIILNPGVEIVEILKKIVEQLKLEADKKGIYLKMEKPEKNYTIKADAEKLKAGLFNIIDNAIKYTKEGGVTVKLEAKQNNLVIKVEDTGIGLSLENIKNLFNRTFERGEEAKKTFTTGRGIGLYIASQIIKEHKGSVWAESKGQGKGSAFYVELPM